jgi:hypothetical protein
VRYKKDLQMSNPNDYYSLDVFELVDLNDPKVLKYYGNVKNPEVFQLSYCDTCQHLRPPRSFHCQQCNCCIELHDHHCPWVGTCIGKRNTRYFAGFLTITSVHAILITIFVVSGGTLNFSKP